MATAVVHYLAAAVTDRGRKRPSNEDAFGFSVEDGIYLVCDGMGGAAAGEIASSVAVDEVLHLLADRSRNPETPLPETVELAICAANEAIFARSQRNQRLSGMGTTLVALTVQEKRAWVLNIGRQPVLPFAGRPVRAAYPRSLACGGTGAHGAHDARRGPPFAAQKRDYARSRHSVPRHAGHLRPRGSTLATCSCSVPTASPASFPTRTSPPCSLAICPSKTSAPASSKPPNKPAATTISPVYSSALRPENAPH